MAMAVVTWAADMVDTADMLDTLGTLEVVGIHFMGAADMEWDTRVSTARITAVTINQV